MKVFHQDRARKKRITVGVLAASVLASMFSLAPAAHAQPNWLEVDCDAEELIEAIELAQAPVNDISVIEIDDGKGCKLEYEMPYNSPASDLDPVDGLTDNALPLITEDLRIVGNGAKIVGDSDGWSFRGLMIDGSSEFVTLEGLTIQDFEVSVRPNNTTTVPGGAGIFNSNGAILTLNNVTVKDNEVTVVNAFGSGGDVAGGAGVASFGGAVVLRNSTVSGNEVNLLNFVFSTTIAAAGGIGFDGDEATFGGGCGFGGTDCGIDIKSSTVKGNKVNATGLALDTAVAAAGGLAVVDGAELTMDKTTVSSNSVNARGGNSTIASLAGAGGIFLDDGGLVHEIARSTIKGNKAHAEGGLLTASLGGAIVNFNETAEGLLVDEDDAPGFADITNVTSSDKTSITDNKASCEGVCLATGGGYTNTVIGLFGEGDAVFNRTVWKGNVADADDGLALGGALALSSSGLTVLEDGSITKNSAKGEWADGGGIFIEDKDFGLDLDGVEISKNKPNDCADFDGEFYC